MLGADYRAAVTALSEPARAPRDVGADLFKVGRADGKGSLQLLEILEHLLARRVAIPRRNAAGRGKGGY